MKQIIAKSDTIISSLFVALSASTLLFVLIYRELQYADLRIYLLLLIGVTFGTHLGLTLRKFFRSSACARVSFFDCLSLLTAVTYFILIYLVVANHNDILLFVIMFTAMTMSLLEYILNNKVCERLSEDL